MEINPKLDCQTARSSDEQDLGHVKSYTCTFCQKDFSNAQALGGHMNIHRKDRAKLKECLDEALLSMDFTRNNDPKAFSKENQDVVSRDKNGILEFPLFVEKPLITSTSAQEGSDCVSEHAEKAMQLSHGSLKTELDLELRLWPRAS